MIVVVGSLNMDLVVRCERIPLPGETVLGDDFSALPGGKGANQAYAAARLSRAPVRMIGKVGPDDFGRKLKANLTGQGIDVTGVLETSNTPSGIATIAVDARGQNSIVVAGGANFQWEPTEPERLAFLLDGATHVLLQLETPLWVVGEFLRHAKAYGAMTIVDPAPAVPLPAEWMPYVDLVTPNETEFPRIGPVADGKLLMKLGARGSRWRDVEVPAIAVEALDSTAAGDVYNAGLAVGLSEGKDMREAMRFATVAAGLSVTRKGAQSSAPTRDEVNAYGCNR